MKRIHPDAQILPLMRDKEYQRLADSIEAEGLVDAITLLDGMVLDGRHRQRACEERGVPPRYEEWDPSCGLTPVEWVIAKNLHRRQLTKAQCAALAVELKPRLAESARQRMLRGKADPRENSPKGGARDIAGATFGVSGRSVSRLEEVKVRSQEVFEEVKAGKKGIDTARTDVGLPKTNEKKRPGSKRERYLALRDALSPAREYVKDWEAGEFAEFFPAEARRLLKQVQEVSAALFEIERALEARTVVSRALR